MSKLRIGLIGLGNMGENHLRILSMLGVVDLSFIYDTDYNKAKKISNQYEVSFSQDLDKALSCVDAVIIASPTSTHYEYILQCAKYVKNIFVEKPLTDAVDDSEKIVNLSNEKKLNIQVGFIERYNPAIATVKDLLSCNGDKTINVDFVRTNKVSSRINDVNVIVDLMIHDIDLALYFNGEVESVQAYGIHQNSVIDFARANIKHKNGAFSSLTASRITEKRMRHISVTTDKSYIDCNLLSKEVFVTKQTVIQSYENASIISQEETIRVKPQEALLSELLSFIDFCFSKKEIFVPEAVSGFEAITVAKQIQENILEK